MKLNLNEPQKESINKLKRILPMSHYVNLIVRCDGKDMPFEADWIKDVVKEIET